MKHREARDIDDSRSRSPSDRRNPRNLRCGVCRQTSKGGEVKHSHVNIGNDEFVASVGSVSVPRDAVIRVRQEIARATRLPVNLISANDPIRELEMVSNGSHPEILDYFTDLLPVAQPKDESALVAVRDFVIEFGPQLR